MNNYRNAVIIAVRDGPSAKSRLAPALAPAERSTLTHIMLEAMLSALADATAKVFVISPSPMLLLRACDFGAKTIQQHPNGNLNAAFRDGCVAALAAGAETVALLPGDLPLLDWTELSSAFNVAQHCGAAIVRSHSGDGTGALIKRKAAMIAPAFGANSFMRHLNDAHMCGEALYEASAPSLAFDVDTPADVETFLKLAEERLPRSIAQRLRALGAPAEIEVA